MAMSVGNESRNTDMSVVESTEKQPEAQEEESIEVEIGRLYYKKQACLNIIEKTNSKIKNLNIDLDHAESIKKLQNNEIVTILPEMDFWIKKYHIKKVRIWPSLGSSQTMIIINFETNKAISYTQNGRKECPFIWHKQWKGWYIQQID